VKDAVDCVWWLSKTPWPKASNRRVLVPYSKSMRALIRTGSKAKERPSGHRISENFSRNNGAAIPSNLLTIPNTESNSAYLQFCAANGIKPHPARFPSALPEFFIRMLTDRGDMVIDPFAGSCVTGEVCEHLGRNWICCEKEESYLRGALGRFQGEARKAKAPAGTPIAYKVSHPGALWDKEGATPRKLGTGRNRMRTRSNSRRALPRTKGQT
jgi:site-specific DNA-methyltransferase (cytosine-N4-specific)